jgi:outer membrane lipoprotein-sorting protein
MNLKSLLSTLLVFCFAASQAQTADEILEKYFAAIGGKDKMKGVKTMTTTQKLSMMGMEMPMTLYSKAPNKQKGVMNLQGTEMVQAYDGKEAWGNNPMKGSKEPQILPVEQADAMADQPFVNVFLDYKSKGHAVTYMGTEDITGIKCHKLELIKNKNNDKPDVTETYFIDSENYIPVMVRSKVMGQDADTFLSDYQDVNGLLFPFLQEGKLGGQTMTKITVEKITLNDNLDDSFFAFPKK